MYMSVALLLKLTLHSLPQILHIRSNLASYVTSQNRFKRLLWYLTQLRTKQTEFQRLSRFVMRTCMSGINIILRLYARSVTNICQKLQQKKNYIERALNCQKKVEVTFEYIVFKLEHRKFETCVADPRSRVLMVMCQIARAIWATRNQGYTLPETPGVIDWRYEKYVIHHTNGVVCCGRI
jgi:hypothetical protein